MITLPRSQQNNTPAWTQKSSTDCAGDFWATFGIDLTENEGRVRLGKRIILNTGTADVAEITSYPSSFNLCGSSVYAFAGASNVGYAFKNDGTVIGSFSKDVSSGAPAKIDSTKSDSVFSNNSMYVSAQQTGGTSTVSLYKKTGDGAWSEITTTATSLSTYTNMLCTFRGRTYMSYQQSKILSLDSTDSITYSGSYALTINIAGDFTNVITKFLPSDDRIFILTVNTMGGKGNVYEWDGQSTEFQLAHRLESSGALSGTILNGVPYIMDTNGDFLAWNGGTFKKLTGLNRENNLPLYNPISFVNNRFIHPNGMSVVNGKIQMLIDNRNYDNGSTIEETIPSGIYEYDERTQSLIHKYGISAEKSTATIDTITQYGNVRIAGAGALKEMGLQSTALGGNGLFLAGASYYTDATTTKSGIFYDDRNDTKPKAGYFISSKIDSVGDKGSGSIKNSWQKVFVLLRKFLTANDKIVVKFRTTDVAPTEATITWTATNTFTTTTDISAYWTAGTGGEVEILQGVGAGICSHITNISVSGGTFTVTVDTAHLGATGTAKARFQAWIKSDSYASQLDTYKDFSIGRKSNWVQLKIWGLWTGKNEIEKLIILNENSTPAK